MTLSVGYGEMLLAKGDLMFHLAHLAFKCE